MPVAPPYDGTTSIWLILLLILLAFLIFMPGIFYGK
jgi:hypothetical protein